MNREDLQVIRTNSHLIAPNRSKKKFMKMPRGSVIRIIPELNAIA